MEESENKNFRSYSDVIEDNHKFLRDGYIKCENWEQKFTKDYEDSLFREYALVDLSRYKKFQIGMRWRTKHDVLLGKGEKELCGEVNCSRKGISSVETFFEYIEDGAKKRAAVKVFLCKKCRKKMKLAKGKNSPSKDKKEKKIKKRVEKRKREIVVPPENVEEKQPQKKRKLE